MCEMLVYKKGSLKHIIYDRNVFMHELLTCSLLLQYMLVFFLILLCRLSAWQASSMCPESCQILLIKIFPIGCKKIEMQRKMRNYSPNNLPFGK